MIADDLVNYWVQSYAVVDEKNRVMLHFPIVGGAALHHVVSISVIAENIS